MSIKNYIYDDDFDDLNGATIDVDANLIDAPTKNVYFVGIFPFALGLAAFWAAFFYYPDFTFGLKFTTESWIFLVLGTLFFGGGIIMLFKAGIYFLTLKPFLQKAKFTKCNVKCIVKKIKRHDGDEKELYTLLASYIDENGRRRTKIFKYLLADKYCQIYEVNFGVNLKWLLDGSQTVILSNYFIMAYNKRGKAVLVYERV